MDNSTETAIPATMKPTIPTLGGAGAGGGGAGGEIQSQWRSNVSLLFVMTSQSCGVSFQNKSINRMEFSDTILAEIFTDRPAREAQSVTAELLSSDFWKYFSDTPEDRPNAALVAWKATDDDGSPIVVPVVYAVTTIESMVYDKSEDTMSLATIQKLSQMKRTHGLDGGREGEMQSLKQCSLFIDNANGRRKKNHKRGRSPRRKKHRKSHGAHKNHDVLGGGHGCTCGDYSRFSIFGGKSCCKCVSPGSSTPSTDNMVGTCKEPNPPPRK